MRCSLPEAPLFNPDPCHYLPHRPPFLFIDRITAREPGISATAEMVVTAESGPFPPILLMESMAQVGGIAAGQASGAGGVLAAISGGQLPLAVPPGVYVVTAQVLKSFGTLHLIQGKVQAGEAIIAEASLTLAVAHQG